jgi:hypothetical protein
MLTSSRLSMAESCLDDRSNGVGSMEKRRTNLDDLRRFLDDDGTIAEAEIGIPLCSYSIMFNIRQSHTQLCDEQDA